MFQIASIDHLFSQHVRGVAQHGELEHRGVQGVQCVKAKMRGRIVHRLVERIVDADLSPMVQLPEERPVGVEHDTDVSRIRHDAAIPR